MHDAKDLENILVVNEGVLVTPIIKQEEKVGNMNVSFAKVNEQNLVLIGWVVKHGPGYHIGMPKDANEDWKSKSKSDDDASDYIPVNIKEGDRIYYHRSNMVKITIGATEYHLIKYHDVLLIDRIKE